MALAGCLKTPYTPPPKRECLGSRSRRPKSTRNKEFASTRWWLAALKLPMLNGVFARYWPLLDCRRWDDRSVSLKHKFIFNNERTRLGPPLPRSRKLLRISEVEHSLCPSHGQ